jgi:O-antigen ligase
VTTSFPPSGPRGAEPALRTFRVCLMVAIGWGTLAFGAVYPWAYWPLAAASAGLGAWAIVRSRAWQDPRARQLALALAAVVAAIAVQVILLPYALLDRLSPGVDAFLREFQLGYHPRSLHTLSLAPERTAAVLGLALSLSIFFVGLVRVVRHLPLEWLTIQLMGLGVALSLLGIVQKAFLDPEIPLLYGFWRPRDGGNPFGPFVNRNHFAGWMVMAMPIVIMHAWAVLHGSERPDGAGIANRLRWLGTVDGNRALLIAFGALVMGAALVLTGSRSGAVSMAIAVLVMFAFILQKVSGRRRRIAAAAYVGVVLAGALFWAGSDVILARFARAPAEIEGRLAAWRDTARIIRDFPVFGTGLGGYARAMLVYQSSGRDAMYAEAHNDYLQLAAEGGGLVGVPAVILLVIVVNGIRRRLRATDDDASTFWIRRGAVAGLVGIAAQSLVEFSLQMPGNAVLLVVLAAIALHRPRSAYARRV